MAMQRCPAAPKAAAMRALRAASGSASGMITAWFCAPRLAWSAYRGGYKPYTEELPFP